MLVWQVTQLRRFCHASDVLSRYRAACSAENLFRSGSSATILFAEETFSKVIRAVSWQSPRETKTQNIKQKLRYPFTETFVY